MDFSADYLDYMAEFARRYEGEIIQSDRPGENILLYKMPIGVIAGILPWNFPFFLIVRKMAPALVTGNTIVIKPSSETPNNAFEFAKLVAQSSLPRGVFNLVSGSGSVVGKALASHPKVGMVSLTGSVDGGVAVMHAAVRQCHQSLAGTGRESSRHRDGRCGHGSRGKGDPRVAHHQHRPGLQLRRARLCSRIRRRGIRREDYAAMKKTVVGDPFDPATEMGPMVSKQAAGVCRRGSRAGHRRRRRAECGGKKHESKAGYYFQPTVLTNCRQETDIMQQEIFGPVLPITTFKNLDEAIEYANDCEYGLTSSIYTHSLDVAMRAANELKFGETYVNRENFEAMQGFHAGWRKSGIGGADGKHGLEEYLQTHVVYMNYDLNKQ